MGKHRRQRQKLHLPAKVEPEKPSNDVFNATMDTSLPILLQPPENLFAGVNINFDKIEKNLADDTRSVKSFKSIKSEAGANKMLLKKDKLKLRREMLMKKIDTVNQMKLESKRRRKRKNISIIGDTNPLYDALPSLQSLLASRSSNVTKIQNLVKGKGTEKAVKRKKLVVQGVKMFKQVMANKEFQKDPLKAISEHVKAVVDQGKM